MWLLLLLLVFLSPTRWHTLHIIVCARFDRTAHKRNVFETLLRPAIVGAFGESPFSTFHDQFSLFFLPFFSHCRLLCSFWLSNRYVFVHVPTILRRKNKANHIAKTLPDNALYICNSTQLFPFGTMRTPYAKLSLRRKIAQDFPLTTEVDDESEWWNDSITTQQWYRRSNIHRLYVYLLYYPFTDCIYLVCASQKATSIQCIEKDKFSVKCCNDKCPLIELHQFFAKWLT